MKKITLILAALCLQFSFAQESTEKETKWYAEAYVGQSFIQGDIGDVANNSLMFGLTTGFYNSSKVSWFLDFNYSAYSLNSRYDDATIDKRDSYGNYTINLGPSYRLGSGLVTGDLYAGLGYAFITTPGAQLEFPGSSVIIDNYDAGSEGAFSGMLGFKIDFKVTGATSLFVRTQYRSTFGLETTAAIRPIDLSTQNDPGFDPGDFSMVPFEEVDFGDLSSIDVMFGVRVNIDCLGGKCEDALPKKQRTRPCPDGYTKDADGNCVKQ